MMLDFFFPDLSFQAASQIMSTPVYDAIKLMKDISQNFPIKARYVKVHGLIIARTFSIK